MKPNLCVHNLVRRLRNPLRFVGCPPKMKIPTITKRQNLHLSVNGIAPRANSMVHPTAKYSHPTAKIWSPHRPSNLHPSAKIWSPPAAKVLLFKRFYTQYPLSLAPGVTCIGASVLFVGRWGGAILADGCKSVGRWGDHILADGCKSVGRWGDHILADGCEYLAVGCTIELACGATSVADGCKIWHLIIFWF